MTEKLGKIRERRTHHERRTLGLRANTDHKIVLPGAMSPAVAKERESATSMPYNVQARRETIFGNTLDHGALAQN